MLEPTPVESEALMGDARPGGARVTRGKLVRASDDPGSLQPPGEA